MLEMPAALMARPQTVSVSLVKNVWAIQMGILMQLSAIEFRAVNPGATANRHFSKRASLVSDAVDEEYRQLRRLLCAQAAATRNDEGVTTAAAAGDFASVISSVSTGEHLFENGQFYGREFRTFSPSALFALNLNYDAPVNYAEDDFVQFVMNDMVTYAQIFGFILSVKDWIEEVTIQRGV